MAKPQNVLIGKTKGSVGEATFSSWKGVNVLKAKPVNSYSNPTTEQLQNNSKFGAFQQFAKTIAVFIILGFKAMAVKMTEYNAFSKANPYSETVTGTAPNYVVDPDEIIIADGPVLQAGLANALAERANDDLVTTSWDSADTEYSNNLVYMAAFNKSTGEFLVGNTTGVLYSAGSIDLALNSIGTNIATTSFHIFMVNPTNGKACRSLVVPMA